MKRPRYSCYYPPLEGGKYGNSCDDCDGLPSLPRDDDAGQRMLMLVVRLMLDLMRRKVAREN